MATPARETILAIEMSAKLTEWKKVKVELNAAKAKEAELRKDLVLALFNTNVDDGTETLNIGNGWKLKAIKSLDYKAENDNVALDALEDLMCRFPGGGQMFEELIRFKPEVSVTAYKTALSIWLNTLEASTRMFVSAAITDVITIKPASTQLELVDPNVKK